MIKIKRLVKDLFRKIKSTRFTPQLILKAVRLGAFAALGFLIVLIGAFFVYANDLPDPSRINSRNVTESSKIYDRNGALLYEIHGEVKRTLIEFDQIPDRVKQATIAIEDKKFYDHKGINLRGVARALFRDLTQGKSEGGSSITQQLVKNALLSPEKKLSRKFKEIILTVRIEQSLEKNDILKLYLNEIPYGQNAYGIEAAAQTYFGKPARDLSVAESAYLAALPQRPSYLNPYGSHRDVLDRRKNHVLQSMAELKFITPEEAAKAQKEEVQFKPARTGIEAPHFVMYIQEILEDQYGAAALEEGGFKVTTTLDLEMQKMAEEAITDNTSRLTQYGATNAGLVAIDPKTGEILAMVGSRDFFDEENDGQVNIAIRDRQPGSSIKPYVYAAAFEEGMGPATLFMDVHTVFGQTNGEPYIPRNYSGKEYGPVSIRKALAGSLNITAVKALQLVGVRDAIKFMKKVGMTSELSPDDCGLSLVLGGCEIKLLDHTAGFAVFANNGIKHETEAILKIENSKNEIVYEAKEDQGEQVVNPEISYLISDVLSDNEARAYIFGSNNYLTLPGRPVAAKTGTTQNWRDAWTVGYTPQLAAGVWAGNMNGKLMKVGADGSIVAGPIWNSFMRKAHANKEVESFKRPDGIAEVAVDSVSGLLPTSATIAANSPTKIEKFASSVVPSEGDNVHRLIKINKNNGLLATTKTPPEYIETRLYTVFHSERPEDPDWENPVRRWARDAGFLYPPTEKDGDGEVLPEDNTIQYTTNDNSVIPASVGAMYIASPKNGSIIKNKTNITLILEESINTDGIKIYLRNNEGQAAAINGETTITQSGDNTTYILSWKVPSEFATGNYTLFAASQNGEKSNFVNLKLE